jgi:UDP-N-acetylglucosamine 1-carboxyvinyltransferase
MLAATLTDGVTTIINAASEPEIADLASMLNEMGANITGAGTHTVRIEGVGELSGTDHRVVADRLEAGTFALGAAITRGDVVLEEAVPEHLDSLIWKMTEAGALVEATDAGMRVRGGEEYRAVNAQALPYPGLATDLQPQLAAFLTQAHGTRTIHERVFDNRLLYVSELRKMGADVVATGQTAIISGPTPLRAARVQALDVRAGTACVLAALVAEGTTEIIDIHHIDRAHEQLHGKLGALGASIERVSID